VERTTRTARESYAEIGADPARALFGTGLYSAWPPVGKPRLTWLNGARVACWVAPDFEFYELDPSANPQSLAWPRPYPEIHNYSQRDYGNRVDHSRLMKALDRCNVRARVSLSVAMRQRQRHPELLAAGVERQWEFFPHWIYNRRYTYGMDESQERAIVEDSIHTERTIDLVNDELPYRIRTAQGELISLPVSWELSDRQILAELSQSEDKYAQQLRDAFDWLYAERGRFGGRLLCVPLTPHITGLPYRIDALRTALAHIRFDSGVWSATGAEILNAWAGQDGQAAAG